MLPVIVGKPYTPKRNPRYGMPREYRCETEGCPQGPDEHTHTVDTLAPVNGSGWLERKASGEIVYHTPWTRTRRPFRMTTPKARVESPAAVLKRLHKELVQDDSKNDFRSSDGMVVTRNTYFWTLLEPSVLKDATISQVVDVNEEHRKVVLIDPEFHLALRRALIVSKIVYLSHGTGAITLRAVDNTDPVSFVETVDALTSQSFSGVTFNGAVVEQILGCWPLTMWVGPKTVVFEPASREWRFVIATMIT